MCRIAPKSVWEMSVNYVSFSPQHEAFHDLEHIKEEILFMTMSTHFPAWSADSSWHQVILFLAHDVKCVYCQCEPSEITIMEATSHTYCTLSCQGQHACMYPCQSGGTNASVITRERHFDHWDYLYFSYLACWEFCWCILTCLVAVWQWSRFMVAFGYCCIHKLVYTPVKITIVKAVCQGGVQDHQLLHQCPNSWAYISVTVGIVSFLPWNLEDSVSQYSAHTHPVE